MTTTNRCDVIVTEQIITAQVAGQDIVFNTRGHHWAVGVDADLGGIILAACTLLDFERGRIDGR